MTVRIVWHIGPMKTGTSAMAAALSAAERRGSLPPGVLYPVDDLWIPHKGNITKHGNVKDLSPLIVAPRLQPISSVGHSVDATEVRATLQRVVAAARERARDDRATVILVNESAARTADAGAVLSELHSLADEVVVVLTVREPRAAAASIIGQAVRTWDRLYERSLSARRLLTQPLRGAEHDYAQIIERWSHADDKVPLLLLPYLECENGTGALMTRFAELIGVGPIEAPPATARGELVHPALSRADLTRLIRMKRAAAALGWIPGVRERIHQRFMAEAKQASQRTRRGESPRFTLTSSDALWVLERARPSIEAVRAWLGDEAENPAWREWFAQLDEPTPHGSTMPSPTRRRD